MYPNATAEVNIFLSCVFVLLFCLGLLLCKPKPMHDNQTMLWVTFLKHIKHGGCNMPKQFEQ
jgi:hypothetical protein